jgi:hypothetical protein
MKHHTYNEGMTLQAGDCEFVSTWSPSDTRVLVVYSMKNPSCHLARGIRQSALENRHEQR